MLTLAAAAPGVAHGAPTTREAAIAAHQQVQADERVPAGWTGSTETCTVGTESQASIDATLRTVNTLRDFAGLQPVVFEATRNAQALAAAVMMRAQRDLSHEPDPSWACYSADGYTGANTSNLFLGMSGAGAMVGYVDDSGVSSLGHRFWVLDPFATTFGTGSTGTSNALAVVDSVPTPARQSDLVAWPPRNTFVPGEWVFGDWSLEIPRVGAWGDPQVDLSAAQVAVAVNGALAPVSGVTALGSSRLKWLVGSDLTRLSADARVDVTITGATLASVPFPIAYSTTILAGAPPTPAPGTPRTPGTPTPDPPATERKSQTTGGVTASIRSGRASRGGKVSVSFSGLADGSRVKLTWTARGASAGRCRGAARKANKTVSVSGGRARTAAPRCKGTYRLRAALGGRELIARTIKVR